MKIEYCNCPYCSFVFKKEIATKYDGAYYNIQCPRCDGKFCSDSSTFYKDDPEVNNKMKKYAIQLNVENIQCLLRGKILEYNFIKSLESDEHDCLITITPPEEGYFFSKKDIQLLYSAIDSQETLKILTEMLQTKNNI